MRARFAVEHDEVEAVERDHGRGHRARGHESSHPVAHRSQRERGDASAVEHLGRQRVDPVEEPGGDRVLDQRCGCEPSTERLDGQRHVEQGGAGTPGGFGHGHARGAHRDQLVPQRGRESERLVATQLIEGNGAIGQVPEDVDDRRLLGGRVEIHGVRILHTDARADLPGPARRRARRGRHSRRGRVRARRRCAPHLRRARPPRPGVGGALAARGIAEGDHVATMLPNTFDAHLTMLALAWLRVVEVPLNVAFTGRMLAYALDHSDVTTLVVAPEFLDAVAAVEAEATRCSRASWWSTTRRGPSSTPAPPTRRRSVRSTATCIR